MAGARILEVRESPGGAWRAVLEVEAEGRRATLTLDRLARRPAEARARVEGDTLIVELLDEKGEGFASCLLSLPGLARGECRSAILESTRRASREGRG